MHGIECEGGEVLRRKKEADDALPLWTSRDVPGAVELWNYPDLSEEELAERSASYRQLHALRKFIDDKMMYYEQALIDHTRFCRSSPGGGGGGLAEEFAVEPSEEAKYDVDNESLAYLFNQASGIEVFEVSQFMLIPYAHQDKFDMAAAALEKGGQEEDDSDHRRNAADSSSFKLLNELGDLLMLPTDMLLGNIMKEICPSIGLPLLKSATSPLTSSVMNKFLEWF
ncbi:hypothetical protein E2562_000780 [Oryza meyeriana var. granulata]|uniref:Uncharacterized protein n=1 Tax=Oryza meyeriana var. granulata TaxID=110450 RepID=A0A6G1DU86_9ORYZ|nr:hypothetical protein E2562_000780 [Oryza meyeriana var. granulata]